jgi:hypothetical protein
VQNNRTHRPLNNIYDDSSQTQEKILNTLRARSTTGPFHLGTHDGVSQDQRQSPESFGLIVRSRAVVFPVSGDER